MTLELFIVDVLGYRPEEVRLGVEVFDIVARDLMEFPTARIVGDEAAAGVIREIDTEPASIFRPDGPLCSDRCDQFTVQVSVVLLDHDAGVVSHLHAPGRPIRRKQNLRVHGRESGQLHTLPIPTTRK